MSHKRTPELGLGLHVHTAVPECDRSSAGPGGQRFRSCSRVCENGDRSLQMACRLWLRPLSSAGGVTGSVVSSLQAATSLSENGNEDARLAGLPGQTCRHLRLL